jgi:hypothetical protein
VRKNANLMVIGLFLFCNHSFPAHLAKSAQEWIFLAPMCGE